MQERVVFVRAEPFSPGGLVPRDSFACSRITAGNRRKRRWKRREDGEVEEKVDENEKAGEEEEEDP